MLCLATYVLQLHTQQQMHPRLQLITTHAGTKALGPGRLVQVGACAPVQALLQIPGVARHGSLAAALAVAVPAILGPGIRDYVVAHQRAAHQS